MYLENIAKELTELTNNLKKADKIFCSHEAVELVEGYLEDLNMELKSLLTEMEVKNAKETKKRTKEIFKKQLQKNVARG